MTATRSAHLGDDRHAPNTLVEKFPLSQYPGCIIYQLNCWSGKVGNTLACCSQVGRRTVLRSIAPLLLAAALAAAGAAAGDGDAAVQHRLLLGYITGSARQPGDLKYGRPGLSISGAMGLAVDELNSPGGALRAAGVRLDFVVAETFGSEEQSIRQTASLWAANVSAIIGPQETCRHEARMAAAFNLPMISYVSIDFFPLETENVSQAKSSVDKCSGRGRPHIT